MASKASKALKTFIEFSDSEQEKSTQRVTDCAKGIAADVHYLIAHMLGVIGDEIKTSKDEQAKRSAGDALDYLTAQFTSFPIKSRQLDEIPIERIEFRREKSRGLVKEAEEIYKEYREAAETVTGLFPDLDKTIKANFEAAARVIMSSKNKKERIKLKDFMMRVVSKRIMLHKSPAGTA
jgi:hypothetical protein